MKNYFLDEFNNNFPITPPFVAEQKLEARFPNALSVAWFKQGENYSAVFTAENCDCVAFLDHRFEITSYKIKLPENSIPQKIQSIGIDNGRIQSSILVWKNGITQYELICLSPQLQNIKLLIDSNGSIIKKI